MTASFGIAIGGRVGPYEITGELGNGGMGVVYRAVHTLLHRPAAIKVLRPELGGYTPALDRFLNEARATTAIRHPGIVEIYDYGHTETGWAYIAMELLDGVTLGTRLAQRGTLPLADALVIARRIANPLAVAHEAGIVHRDLKPDNVFLIRDPEGGVLDQVKLLDFGIAKLQSAGSRTTAGMILGTPAYMSPEQCRGIPDCDHRADLYALGCILFELVTGAPPFGRDSSMTELMAAHLNAPIPELPRATVPVEVGRLIRRLLAKSPADRPGTALDVVLEIDRYLASIRPGHPGLPPAKPSLRSVVAMAAGLALSLASVGAWSRWLRAPRGEQPVLDGSIRGSVRAQGTAVVPPLDTAPTIGVAIVAVDAGIGVATASTIGLDAAARRQARDAHPRSRVPEHDANSEVTIDLGTEPSVNADTPVTN